jgi:hypothetical protein
MNTLEQLDYLEKIIEEVECYLIADDPDAAYRVIEAYKAEEEKQSIFTAKHFPELKEQLDRLEIHGD